MINTHGRGVIYYVAGNRHAVVLAVSAMSLRNWWHGPVLFLAGDDAGYEYSSKVAEACDGKVERFEQQRLKRHSGYTAKTAIPSLSPFKFTLQIDADTLIVGPLDEIWPTHERELVITSFSDWRTNARPIAKRIKPWREAFPVWVDEMLKNPYPAINTGVISYGSDSLVARKAWPDVTAARAGTFIADELAMQILFPWFEHVRVVADEWNYSPTYGAAPCTPRIFHLHGFKTVRRDSYRKVWLPFFSEALRRNYAGVRDWMPAGDKRLRRWLAENPSFIKEASGS